MSVWAISTQNLKRKHCIRAGNKPGQVFSTKHIRKTADFANTLERCIQFKVCTEQRYVHLKLNQYVYADYVLCLA